MIINLAKIRFGGTGNTGGGAPAKPEDSFQETYTANGAYDITPEAGHVFSGGHVEVDVHPTESLSLTITESGSYTSNDEFNGYSINVDVEGPKPEETLTQTITENGSHVFNPSEGHVFNSASITVDVPQGITPTGTINISANGTYDVTDKATAVVAVGGKDYRYKTGTPDVAGLTAIGWTADDIGYYGANTPHYAWENDNYKVSQENIDLYSLDDPQPSLYKNNPNVTFVPNKNMSTYFGATSGYQAFSDMKYIKGFPWYDTSNVTKMNSMFRVCVSLQTIPQLNTSKVTDMDSMFSSCKSLVSIPQLDTSNVTKMGAMFDGCSSLQSIPLLDTSNVTGTNQMFRDCSSLQSIPLLDTGKATNMNEMFRSCKSLVSIPQLDTSNVTNMANMFDGCTSLTSVPSLDTSKVKYMSYMFDGCTSLTSVPSLDTSKVTSMSSMIKDCSRLQSVEGIDFSSMTSSPYMFFGYSYINTLTHFIVNGSINFSWNDSYGLNNLPNLDYESIKSILEAMNRTTNTDAKTMKLNCVVDDKEGELTGLVASCAAKGWTITGLNVFEYPLIKSITPSSDHIHISDMRPAGSGLTLTIDANYAWKGAGVPKDHLSSSDYIGYQYDFYDANTDEFVRSGNYYGYQSGLWSPYTGSEGVTSITGHYGPSDLGNPRSGEYALVGISFKNATSPYLYYDYYFKVYPDGE